MTLIGENLSIQRKTSLSITFSTKKPTCTGLGSKAVLRGERPATNLSYLFYGRWDSHPIASKPAECTHLSLLLHGMRDPSNNYAATNGRRRKTNN
jgi:hypothetical protein